MSTSRMKVFPPSHEINDLTSEAWNISASLYSMHLEVPILPRNDKE